MMSAAPSSSQTAVPAKAPITGVVVSFNEGRLLERCLPSLAFCDEVLVINLESTDNTAEVAARHGARVVNHPRVPVMELVLKWGSDQASHDWVLSIDPDEEMSPKLGRQIAELITSEAAGSIGRLEIPWQFYFGDRALKGTYWGGENYKRGTMFHRDRVTHIQQVHHRPLPKEGYSSHLIPWEGDNVLHHYWMTDYRMFIEKHLRYLKMEGQRRKHAGETFSWWRTIKDTCVSFAWSIIRRKAYLDGVVGIGLSGLYAWYVGSSWLSLRRLEGELSASHTAEKG